MKRQSPTSPAPERAAPNAHLRRYEELETLYAEAPVGLCVLDSELRYLRVNERLARLHGQSVDAYLGRSVDDVMPGDRVPIAAHCRQVLATGAAVTDVVDEFDASPGGTAPQAGSTSYFPLKSERGEVECVCVVTRESTEGAGAHEAIEESLGFESLASEAATLINKAAADELDASIGAILTRLGRVLRAERIRLVLGERDVEHPMVRYEVVGTKALPARRMAPGDTPSAWPTDALARGETVRIHTPADFPKAAAAESAEAQALGIRSVLYAPFGLDGTPGGHFSIGRCTETRDWPAAVCRRLELMGRLMVSAIVAHENCVRAVALRGADRRSLTQPRHRKAAGAGHDGRRESRGNGPLPARGLRSGDATPVRR
jgi:hypothetical protein